MMSCWYTKLSKIAAIHYHRCFTTLCLIVILFYVIAPCHYDAAPLFPMFTDNDSTTPPTYLYYRSKFAFNCCRTINRTIGFVWLLIFLRIKHFLLTHYLTTLDETSPWFQFSVIMVNPIPQITAALRHSVESALANVVTKQMFSKIWNDG